HPTSVQEHSLRAGGTDPLREDLPSGQEHPLQGDESDPLREDLNLVLDQHRQQGDSDPLRKDPPSVLDPSLRAGDSDPLRTDSPRRSPRASLSGPSLRPDGVHPLRKDHVSTVPSSHLQEEDDSWLPLPSRIGQERHQQRSLMVNDRQPRQVSSVHHDHHEYRDQRSGGHVQHPQLRGQRTTFTEANGSHDLSIQQRCLESQEDRQPPQQRFGYQEDGREHRLRQTILSSLRA
ncbi:hypothetical protein FOL46_002285, partial [Perkinsus olseni]